MSRVRRKYVYRSVVYSLYCKFYSILHQRQLHHVEFASSVQDMPTNPIFCCSGKEPLTAAPSVRDARSGLDSEVETTARVRSYVYNSMQYRVRILKRGIKNQWNGSCFKSVSQIWISRFCRTIVYTYKILIRPSIYSTDLAFKRTHQYF